MNKINSNKKKRTNKAPESSYEKIKRALENPNYKFRTINGVASEAHVSFEAIEKAMREHSDEIVKLFRKGENGEVSLLIWPSPFTKLPRVSDSARWCSASG
ncbi:hypothetical protein [Pseudomonas wenzhouensis]|uniref:hypothetical protein n=1 Tax=Pseudomonas wenzhouensis TaxID=2906062 RepID=UPI001E64D456|nr:hypothetical protein [Pseudomonas wenzhouensis]UFQ96798.1 hypothetical protein J7655_16080 [Pseudomonas wenzhouensis]